MTNPPLDWGAAYEEEYRATVDLLMSERARGSRKWQFVPWLHRSVEVVELDDDEIRSIALREAEMYTQRAINRHRHRDP